MTEGDATASSEWRKHWTLVLAGMMGMSFYSVVTYSLGTFIEPLEKEFGWSRAEISGGLTIFTMTAMVGGPFIGALIDRFGTRRVAVPGLLLHAAAFAAFSLANGSIIGWLVLWGVLAAVALSTKSLIWSAAVSSTFSVSRSMALAVMLSGTALGQTLAPLTSHWLIDNYGWRQAYVGLGFGWGGLALLLVVLFFVDAREHQKRAGGAPGSAAMLGGLTVSEAIRDSRVLRIAVANLFVSLVGSGVSVHLVPILSATGIPRTSAVELAALAGIGGIVGKLLVGWLLDRVPGSLIPFVSFALPALGYFLLIDTFDSVPALMVGVVVIGFSGGAGLQATTYLISRYAGMRNFGKIFGTVGSMLMLGSSIGPLLAGTIYDVTGSYAPLLTGAVPVVLLCSLLFVGLGPFPKFALEPALVEAKGR
jgi:MFS family permease